MSVHGGFGLLPVATSFSTGNGKSAEFDACYRASNFHSCTLSSGQVDHHMTLCGGGRGINVHVHSFPTFFASLGRLICHCLKLTVRLVIQFHHGSNCYCFLFVTVLVFDADVHSISLGLIVAACFLLLRWCLMLMLAVFPWD